MRGEQYLSGFEKLKLAECRVVLKNAYNEYFPSLLPIENIEEGDRSKVMGEAMRRGDDRVAKLGLDYFMLHQKSVSLDMKENPILIGT